MSLSSQSGFPVGGLTERPAQSMNDGVSDKRVRTMIRIQATACELILISASQLPETAPVARAPAGA